MEAGMSGRVKKVDEDIEITAQPKSISDELGQQAGHEQGLSVEPEDLGRAFLSDATEQGNFESARGGENEELWMSSAARTDDAITGPNFEVDHDVWENTVNLSIQNGETASVDPLVEEQDDGLHMLDDDVESEDIDLTESVIQEASLLDHEGEELGETESPEINTDDSKSHGKRRGGHAPKESRHTSPRAR
jgi:hypothetical protein